MKKKILQQFYQTDVNNGGPATGAKLLMNSFLKDKYDFYEMSECHTFKKGCLDEFLYFYKTIKKINPDIVHIRGVQSEGFWGVLAAKMAHVKCVMSVHGLQIDSLTISPFKRFLFKHIFEPYALRNADLVYCVCDYAAKRDFIKKHTRKLYGYIHNAAPNYDLSDKNVIRHNKRKEFGVKDNVLVITYIGRVTTDKGIDLLLEAFSDIIKKYENIVLCIGGNGSYIPVLKTQYKSLINQRKVILLGKISDVKETLIASDIFVFPTLHENLSNSLLEAASVSLPIIATNVGGNPEIIQNDYSGILIKENDVSEIKGALVKYIENPSFRLSTGNNVNKHVCKYYSQDYIFHQMSDMYDSLLKK